MGKECWRNSVYLTAFILERERERITKISVPKVFYDSQLTALGENKTQTNQQQQPETKMPLPPQPSALDISMIRGLNLLLARMSKCCGFPVF